MKAMKKGSNEVALQRYNAALAGRTGNGTQALPRLRRGSLLARCGMGRPASGLAGATG